MVDINSVNKLTDMDAFKSGEANITKSDLLTAAKSEIISKGTVSDKLLDIIDSYDSIDTNGDGISIDEFKTYQNSAQGAKNSLKSQIAEMTASINSSRLSMIENMFSKSNQGSDNIFSLLSK